MKEFVGDVDELLAEFQQDIGMESGQPGKLNQELKDCVDKPRRVSQRVPRQESLRMWFRIQVYLRESLRVWIRVDSRMGSSMYSSVSTCRTKTLCHDSGKSVEY